MRSVDEGFLLLARGGRTPHTLPSSRTRADELRTERRRRQVRVAGELARHPPSTRTALRVLGAVAVALAGALRRGTELGA